MSISAANKQLHAQVVLDAKRLAALYQTNLLDISPDKDFDRLTKLTCERLKARFAFITLIDSNRIFFLSMHSSEGPLSGKREFAPMYSFCQNVIVTNESLAIESVRDGGLICNSEVDNALGIVAYLGTPLITPDNERIGSLCVVENEPRAWTGEEKKVIEEFGELVVKEIALRYYANEHLRAEENIATHIAALKDVNAALEQKNKELLKANAVKDDFLATMSHEIRTPMNGVIGFTNLLLETQLEPLQREYTDTIRTSSEALLDIINDILDFSAINSGKIQLNRFTFSVHTCLSEVLDVISLKASSKGLEIGYVVDRGVPELLVGDVGRIRQILVNLLGNAVKFTEKGQIDIHASIDTSVKTKRGNVALHLVVNDTGPGIPTDKFETIFQSFSQVDASDSRRYSGTGLGLSICKGLCILMGGMIWVESEEGAGSSFHVVLELELAAQHDNSLQPSYQIRNKQLLVTRVSDIGKKQLESLCTPLHTKLHFVKTNNDLLEMDPSTLDAYDAVLVDLDMSDISEQHLLEVTNSLSQQERVIFLQRMGSQNNAFLPFSSMIVNKPIKRALFYSVLEHSFQFMIRENNHNEPTSIGVNGVSQFNILVAEDNYINRQLITRFLQMLGHKGECVINGNEVIHALEKGSYDLILMDINMPECDGIEATEMIRSQNSSFSDIYIIGITASIRRDIPRRCIEAGMNDFLSKPLAIDDLSKALDKVPKFGIE